MEDPLNIDPSLSCKLRTTPVELSAQTAGTPQRQQLPATPMPGRRWVRVLNFGLFGATPGDPPTELNIMIGDQSVRWTTNTDASGVVLRVYESLEFEVDETVPIYGVLDPSVDTTLQTADVRVLEIG